MKQLLKSPFLALVIVAALAAGTALIAGYVDRPGSNAQGVADSQCVDCPKAGTEACCKVGDACPKAETCATACEQGTCAAKPAAGCCQEKAQTASCPAAGGEAPVASPCGAGGCTLTE